MKKRLLMLLSLFMAVTSVGWIHAQDATVSTVDDLKAAITAGKSPIKLSATTFELSAQLVINKPITIEGVSGTVLKAVGDNWPAEASKMNLISVEASEKEGSVQLSNMTIMNSKGAGINAQSNMKVTLNNITLKDNAKAGLLVHSEVIANGLHTSGNVWGGVNVDKGNPAYTPSFTFDPASTFAESSKIWSELKDTESTVKAPEGWYSYVGVQGASSEEKRYWTNSKLTVEDQITVLGDQCKSIFGNGNPITVEQAETGKVKISVDNNPSDFVILNTSDKLAIFGGKNGESVSGDTKVTLMSGIVSYVFGGGYGASAESVANVSGTASVNIVGGIVNGPVYGGSLGYGKIENVKTTVSGADTKITRLCAGGAAPVPGNTPQTTFDAAWNAVRNVTMTINDATLTQGFGCGGGFSYAYTGISKVTANKAKLGSFYGVLANGYADNIQATLTKCTFIKDGIGYREIGAINRGKIKDASFSFDKCTFEKATNLSTVTVSLGAIEGWGNSDTNGDPVPAVTGSVAFTFTGCTDTPDMVIGEGLENANVTLTGAKAVLKHYHRGSGIVSGKGEKYMDAFKIASDKTWTFNNGFEINQTGAAEGNTVTLTNNGTLNVKGIDNVADLNAALTAGANQINLAAGNYELASHLFITKPVVIEGTITEKDSTVIKPASNWSASDGTNKNLIRIDASNTSLKNLLVEGSGASGLHVHKATGVTLDNVISRNNKAAGLIVNGSEVTATNFRTSGNDWYGVNVDKGQDIQSEPVFTIGAGCSFAEKVAIKSDAKDAPASYVVGNGWFKTTAKIDSKDCSIWINGATSGLDFAITSVPATVIYGQANLPLLTNVDSAYYKADKVKISILEKNQKFVEIKKTKDQPDSLVILKPGKVTLSLAVGDTTVTQPLTVLKKTLTITGITTKEARDYDGKTEVTLNTTDMKVDGLVGVNQEDVVTPPTKGEALSANAGLQPVKVTATLKNNGTNYSDYYELAEITGVIDTIKKVELTVTATVSSKSNTKEKDTLVVEYGTLPSFGVNYKGFVSVNGAAETEAVLSGTLKNNSSATTTSLAGTYSVTPSGLTATNYDIKYVSAPFKIKAIAPTVEMTGVEVVSLGTEGTNNASVKVTGRVTSNGGTKMEDLKGSFKVKTNGDYEVKAQDLKVENGTFSATLEGLASAETSIQAFAKAGELENTATDDKAMSVNLALKLQNVSFATTFSTLTYGIDPISLTAEGFVEDAKVTFKSSDESILAIADSNKMSVVKPGVATITVTATKDQYITAVAKQTITVKKKALAVTPEAITKKYDGTTDVEVTGKLPELEGLQAASLDAATLDAHFANKNVGTSSVKLAGEFALSVGSDYYELVQPTNLTGTIEKGGEVTVEVSNVTRNYNEKALRYDLKVLVDSKELASSEYTGAVSVTETKTGDVLSGHYTVKAEIIAPNYGDVKVVDVASGNVDIIKGTPKVLTYNVDQNTISGLLLDKEGWGDANVKVINEADGKAHASVYYNGGKDSIVGKSLANATPPTIEWNFKSMMKSTKAVTTQSVQYGQTATFTKAEGVSFESSNPNVFVVKEGTDDKMMIETIGVGTAAIIAKGTGNSAGVTCLQVTVDPKPITLTAVGTIEKVYDGTTTAHVTLTPSEELVGASIDLTDVSFNFAQSKVGAGITVLPSKDIVLKNNNDALASAANYTISIPKLTGNITQRKLTFTGTEVNKFYDGTNTAELTDYSATGLIEGETVPALTATFKEANGNDAKNVATGLKVTLAPNSGNYKLVYEADKIKGNIVKSTIDATLPAGASSDTNLAANVALVVRETGKKVTKSQIDFTPLVSHEGSGSTAVYYISGGDNDNYSVVYDKNQIGFKADQSGDGGSTTVSVSSVSLDKTELTLPRQGTYTLKATINPSDASDKSVTWKSSDESVATVDANGKVTALKVGKATITVTTVDGGKTASCEVTVDFATGLEEALANTQVYAKQGNIYVNPVQPLQLTIVNMIGKVVYNARISCYAQIPVAKGIYIVKLTNDGNTVVTKVNVY